MGRKLINYNARLQQGEEKRFSLTLNRYSFAVGADVDKGYVAFSIIYKNPDGNVQTSDEFLSIIRQYPNYPSDLIQAREWVLAQSAKFNSEHPQIPLIIESTGVYHKLCCKIFAGHVNVTLINPLRVKALLKVEGKDDHKDAATLAKLGMSFDLRGSISPSEEQSRLRDAMRLKRKLINERTRYSNRIGTFLTQNNVPLPNAIKMLSVTGKAIVKAIVDGERDVHNIIPLISGLSKSMQEQLHQVINNELSLKAVIENYEKSSQAKKRLRNIIKSLQFLPELTDYNRNILRQLFNSIEYFEEQIDQAEIRVQNEVAEYKWVDHKTGEIRYAKDIIQLICTAPIFSTESARSLIAEVGLNFDYVFPSASKLATYLGLVPRTAKSGGKVVSMETLPGNSHFKTYIVQGAASFLRRKTVDTGQNLLDWGKEYQRTTDPQHARVALARMTTESVWHMVHKGEPYDSSQHKLISQRHSVGRNVNRLQDATNELNRIIRPEILDKSKLAQLTQTAHQLNQLVGIHVSNYTIIKFDKIALQNTDLPTRARNVLIKAGITDTNDLFVRLISGSLISIPGIAEKSFAQIVTWLSENEFIKERGVTP